VPAILPSETIAHVKDGKPHGLEGHLREVGELAGVFASRFGNEDWAHLAGLWHDLGKYKADFQEYLRRVTGYERDEAEEGGPGKVDHTAAGAIHAVERMGKMGRILGYLIAGHHSGVTEIESLFQFSNSLLENFASLGGRC